MAKKRAAPRGLTPARRKKAVREFSVSGIYARVADALGVDYDTLLLWRRADPSFQEELDVAGEEYDQRICFKYRQAIELHADSVLAGERLPDRYQVDPKGGGRVLVQEGEKVPLNAALARTALTRMDPRWTHPKQEVEHSGSVTLEQSIAAAEARLKGDG